MFATIETNGATHIAIHIPKDGADKSLPAIAAMLEHNAVFIRKSWQDLTTVKPQMGITLGDSYAVENDGLELLIAASDSVVDDSFVVATPDVFASNAKSVKAKNEEISRLRTELSFVKDELASAREVIRKLTEVEEA